MRLTSMLPYSVVSELKCPFLRHPLNKFYYITFYTTVFNLIIKQYNITTYWLFQYLLWELTFIWTQLLKSVVFD